MKDTYARQRGFTLIELSIVLVIIGLIVGGVLTGRDLIVAAEVRKTGTLVEQIQTATMAFQSKYNCLPGDCEKPSRFFLLDSTCGYDADTAHPGTVCDVGDGDGNIFGLSYNGNDNAGRENVNFFHQLVLAGLLADTRLCSLQGTRCFDEYATAYWGLQVPFSTGAPGNTPAAISIFSLKSTPWLVGTPAPSANHALFFGAYSTDAEPVIAPSTLFMLDSKFDDGLPLTGKIQAVGPYASSASGDPRFGVWNGWGANAGSFQFSTAACNNTGVSPSVYASDTRYQCPAMWMMGF